MLNIFHDGQVVVLLRRPPTRKRGNLIARGPVEYVGHPKYPGFELVSESDLSHICVLLTCPQEWYHKLS